MDLIARRRIMMIPKKANDSYLTFTAAQANSSVQLVVNGTPPSISLEYNLNGSGWDSYTVGNTINLTNVGDYVKIRGINQRLASSTTNYHNFSIAGTVDASGDLTSLLNSIGGDVSLNDTDNSYAFFRVFYNCSSLRKAPELPSTSISLSCYRDAFRGCSGLISPPSILPAESLKNDSCNSMFYGCKNMESFPVFCSKTTARIAMTSMFRDCKKIVSAELNISSGMNNTQAMWYVFYNCTSLEDVTIQSLGTASAQIFYDCTSLRSLTVKADTPPSISSTTFQGMPSDCIIYVPDNSVNAYKTTQYWQDRASYIKGISEKP